MNLALVQEIREELHNNCILKLSPLTFRLIVEGAVTCEGSEAIIRLTAEAHEFEGVEVALAELMLGDHNKAEFGINRTFMYAKQDRGLRTRKFEMIQ